MFLIFGINDGNESLGARWCPYLMCHPNGAWMEITCTYQAFTLFFIPLFRISKRYFATCPYCGSVYEIPKEEWKRLSRDSSLPLNPDTLYIVYGAQKKTCPVCNSAVAPESRFCPNCGTPLI